MAEPLGKRGARRLGLLQTIAEVLARAFVDDDGGHGGERLAVFVGNRGIGEREHEQRERDGAHQRRARTGKDEQEREHKRNRSRCPHHVCGYERGKGNTEIQRFKSGFRRLLTHLSCAGRSASKTRVNALMTRASISFARSLYEEGWIAPELGLARVPHFRVPQVGRARLAVSSPAMTLTQRRYAFDDNVIVRAVP